MDFPKLLEAAYFRPTRLVFPDSWIGHIPFAAWLIKTSKPSIFVELGTHSGNSYLAFCQAVKEDRLLTRCYAIDTWKGDKHAGFYGEEIYSELYKYHEQHYSSFSSLLRMTFDEGVSYFGDGSIELLHIDGLHTYEAVKHDFTTWLPKLSPHAIVVFHDTNVREREFGIWKYWQEICLQYSLSFEFVHAHGLGVVQLSPGQGHLYFEWLKPEYQYRKIIKDYFTNLGSLQIEIYRKHEIENSLKDLGEESSRLQRELQTNQAQLAEREQHSAATDAQLAECEQNGATLLALLAEQEKISYQEGLQLAEREQQINTLRTEKGSTRQELERTKDYLAQREQILQRLNNTLLEIYSSTAWKVIRLMWKFRLWIAPKGTWQEKLLRSSFVLMKKVLGRVPQFSGIEVDSSVSVSVDTRNIPEQISTYDDSRQYWRKHAIEDFFTWVYKAYPYSEHISHFILLPLFSTGGAELVASNYAKLLFDKYVDRSVLVIVTDKNIVDHHEKILSTTMFLNLEEFLHTNDTLKKKIFVYDLIKLIKPSVIHNINSSVMWELIIDKGDEIRIISKIYANIFCFQFNDDGSKMGYAHTYLRKAVPYLDGLISDNQRFINDAINEYKLQDFQNKFHTIYTPIQQVSDDDNSVIQERLEKFETKIKKSQRLKCIWAGRLDLQKRWDLFISLVEKCDFCDFDMYGKSVMDLHPSIPVLPNLNYSGTFESLSDVFIKNDYDAFIFTSQWEGIPTILLFTGAYGVPIVAPTVGGVVELVSTTTGYPLPEKPTVDDYIKSLQSIKNNPSEAANRARNMKNLLNERHCWPGFVRDITNLDGYLD
jgi:glycosyltransferase involved in cell wall biosynthesis